MALNQVSELLQFKRRKKSSKDKLEPSVKRELISKNSEADYNQTQESNPAEDPLSEVNFLVYYPSISFHHPRKKKKNKTHKLPRFIDTRSSLKQSLNSHKSPT